MKKFYNPFSAFIFYNNESKVSNHDELKTWIVDCYHQSPVYQEGNFYGTGFTTYFYDDFSGHLNIVDQFKELEQTILLNAQEYIANSSLSFAEHHSKITHNTELELKKLWFNVNPPNAYQGRHHHADYLLGGTYYVSVPPSSGAIDFSNPNPYAYFLNQRHNTEDYNVISSFAMKTGDGDLLIWPGWMDHEVNVNRSNDLRITVSFAIDWKKND